MFIFVFYSVTRTTYPPLFCFLKFNSTDKLSIGHFFFKDYKLRRDISKKKGAGYTPTMIFFGQV